MGDRARDALASARPAVFWTDHPDRPAPAPALRGGVSADLAICGGGYTGLWAAVQALEADPGRRIVVLEADECGSGASTRNGGQVDASLTHGLANGLAHWPEEVATLVRMGRENLAGLEATLDRHGVDAGYERVAELDIARQPWELEELAAEVAVSARYGRDVVLLDGTETRRRLDSPTFIGARLRRDDYAVVDPARLAWGLRAVAERLGATVHDHSRVASIDEDGRRLVVQTAQGHVTADRVVVATNAYRAPVRPPRRYVIPVHDHVLASEPLSSAQRVSIGWAEREAAADAARRFHYYRLTADDRIVWGGYDAAYHFMGRDPSSAQSRRTHELIAENFFTTFPQLEGLRFTHRWSGPIGTTTRFTAAWGRQFGGRLVWIAGYTGLGIAASRFGARVALDLVDGVETERTALRMVRRRPLPFPPEPVRSAGVALTKRAIADADERGGREGPWLRLLDRFGVGFDS